MDYYYLSPKLYGSLYPPVNTNFNHEITDWASVPNNSQTLCSIVKGNTVLVDKQYYGFKTGKSNPTLQLKINGEDQTTVIGTSTNRYEIPAGTILYGYSITPTYINLWTNPTYIDNSQPVMYGRRGIYVNLFTDDVYDYHETGTDGHGNYTMDIAILHGLDLNDINFTRTERSDGKTIYLWSSLNGNYSKGTYSPNFKINSNVISTGSVEQEINRLDATVNALTNKVRDLEETVNGLIPDLTKLISGETSKFYVAR